MKTPLTILLIEDSEFDAKLITQSLEAWGFALRASRIHTEAQLREALDFQSPDLVISDHGLPAFGGFKALDIVRRLQPDLPFIFVSGSNDQAMVVEMYDHGATDYVFKNDLHDLEGAVRGALEERNSSSGF